MYIHIFDCNEEGTIDDIFICDLHRVTYYHTYKTVVHQELGLVFHQERGLFFQQELGLFFHIKGRGILYVEGTTSMVCWLACSSRVCQIVGSSRWSYQIKEYIIVILCSSATYATSSGSKDLLARIRIMCPSEATCLPADVCCSELLL